MVSSSVVNADIRDDILRLDDTSRYVGDCCVGGCLDVRMKFESAPHCVLHLGHEPRCVLVHAVVRRPEQKYTDIKWPF